MFIVEPWSGLKREHHFQWRAVVTHSGTNQCAGGERGGGINRILAVPVKISKRDRTCRGDPVHVFDFRLRYEGGEFRENINKNPFRVCRSVVVEYNNYAAAADWSIIVITRVKKRSAGKTSRGQRRRHERRRVEYIFMPTLAQTTDRSPRVPADSVFSRTVSSAAAAAAAVFPRARWADSYRIRYFIIIIISLPRVQYNIISKKKKNRKKPDRSV